MIYTTKRKTEKDSTIGKFKIGRTLLVCLFWVIAWQIASMVVGNSLLLPSVTEAIVALGAIARTKVFYMNICWTIFRCVLAILMSVTIGALLAVASYRNSHIKSLMTLPVTFFKAVPVMAIVIYVILLLQADWVAVAACFLMCFPLVYTNILTGLEAVPADLLEVATVYRLKAMDRLRLVYIPSIMPEIYSAMRVVAGLSWKAVVAAEVLSVPQFSLGQGMLSAKYYLETPTLFAYIFVIVVLSLVLEKVILCTMAKFTKEKYSESKLSRLNNGKCVSEELKPPRISIENMSKNFGDKVVLRDFNGCVEAGSRVAILGDSGRGKTTLVRILTGLEFADTGVVKSSETIKTSYLFQEDRLLPWLNVYDNLALGLLRDNKSSNNDLIYTMAKDLEIDEVLWSMPTELSGGMRHRVALGRALLAEANLLILDEPFRGLDEELKRRIANRLWEKTTYGKTVLVITHNHRDKEMLGIQDSISM